MGSIFLHHILSSSLFFFFIIMKLFSLFHTISLFAAISSAEYYDDFAPSYYQPPENHYVVDVTITKCDNNTNITECPVPETNEGKWILLEKDLSLNNASELSLLFYKVKDEIKDNERVVTDIVMDEEDLCEGTWIQKSNGIWLKYSLVCSPEDAVTAIDVLFGEDAVEVRPKWKFINDKAIINIQTEEDKKPYITFRRGSRANSDDFRPNLKVRDDGKFKILQIADLHFSTGVGKCLDIVDEEDKINCEADPKSIDFINDVLDIENPDLVVLTGDNIDGRIAPDPETAIFKTVSTFIERKIPYATVLGNHDDESIQREEYIGIISSLPYSVTVPGPEEVDGLGNFVFNLEGAEGPLLLYFLDSHAYGPNNTAEQYQFDWLKQSQFDYLHQQHQRFAEESDTSKNLSISFFHIPLPEHNNTEKGIFGADRGINHGPAINSGGRDVLEDIGVHVVGVGHAHYNEFILNDKEGEGNEIWLGFGCGAGFGGYGAPGMYRKMRSYDVDTNVGEISTYKTTENGDVVERFKFVDDWEMTSLEEGRRK